MERMSSIGNLTDKGGLWIGRFINHDLGADVELLVNADRNGPSESDVVKIRQFLDCFREKVLAFRRRLFLGWTYYPIRIAVTTQGSLGVQFKSFLPFMRTKMIQDDGTVF
jgi:hypothetical protein